MSQVDSSKIVVCIPIYKAKLSFFEQIAIRQMKKILVGYKKVFFAPDSLKFDFGELGEGVGVERFPDYFFFGVVNYSALMLNVDFYKRFSQYEYMLVYQTDAFVFSDRLSEFCAMGYDYIGAPIARENPLWNFIAGRVGNGGLSLRKINSAIRMLEQHRNKLEGPLATIFWQWEDIFWGHCGQQKDFDFQVAPIKIAAEFALDDTLPGFKRLKKGWRPFGGHGWWQRNYARWKPVIEDSGYKLPAWRKKGKEQHPGLNNYIQSHKTINMYYLWGLYSHNEFYKMLTVLQTWLTDYPAQHLAWQLNMENIICLWRRVEDEQKNNKIFRIYCQRLLTQALQNSLQGGVTFSWCRNLLVTILPYLEKYDYEPMQELAGKIKEDWWKIWVDSGQKSALPVENKTKKIIVLSKVTDEDWLLESFVRHTLTFATALIMDVRIATRKSRQILAQLEAEGLPIILHEQSLRWQQVADDMDFVLCLSPDEFLLTGTLDKSVYKILCKLEKGQNYAVEKGIYMPYLPFAYKDKFILSRPLLWRKNCNGWMHLLPESGGEVQFNDGLYVAKIEGQDDPLLAKGIMHPEAELSDISHFAPGQELKYTH